MYLSQLEGMRFMSVGCFILVMIKWWCEHTVWVLLAEAGLILLSLSSKCCDYKCAQPYLALTAFFKNFLVFDDFFLGEGEILFYQIMRKMLIFDYDYVIVCFSSFILFFAYPDYESGNF